MNYLKRYQDMIRLRGLTEIGEIFHIDCQGEGGSPGGIGPGTVPALRVCKRRNQKGSEDERQRSLRLETRLSERSN